MSILKNRVAQYAGNDIFSYTLDNENGLCATILNYGGIIQKLIYKGTDVVLGYDCFEDYVYDEEYFGAIVGRNSNRIENSEFELNGKKYKLNENDGKHNLHGGIVGFNKKCWSASFIDSEEPSISLFSISPDGEEGYPGNLKINVTYTITKDNSLKIYYEGMSDADTVLNMTNHTYFNLNGHSSGDICCHSLWLNSCFYTPNTRECVPTGEILSVENTPFDFTEEKTFKEKFDSGHPQIEMFGGFDHNIVLTGVGYRKAAKLCGDKSGICMEMYTDRPGMQLYTANSLGKISNCKDGAEYTAYSGVCLETQTFPNSMKFSHFPSGILEKNKKYSTMTVYKFLQ